MAKSRGMVSFDTYNKYWTARIMHKRKLYIKCSTRKETCEKWLEQKRLDLGLVIKENTDTAV